MSNQDDSQAAETEQTSQEDLYSLLREEQKLQQSSLEDIRLLKNRIKHLKREYGIAQQKINETKQRAAQIVKQKMDRRAKEKQMEELALARSKEVNKISTSQRMQVKVRKQTKFEQNLQLKRQGTRGVCEIKNRIKKQLDEQRQEDLRRKRQRNKKIQEDQRIVQQEHKKRLREQKEKQKAAQLEKLRADQQVIDDKAKEVERLEKLELELIEKLRGTQVVQRGAFEQLEQVLTA